MPTAVILAGPPETVLYLETDHLDTPRLARNAQKKIVWRWESDAFGSSPASEDPDNDGNKTTINLRFPGQYYDQESGMHYNWHRVYDPGVGRYLSPDPIGLDGGINLYSYVDNAPTMYTDPEGLLLTALHALQQGTTMNEAIQAGATGNAAAAAGAAAAATTAAAAAATAAAGAAGTAAICTPTGRALTAAGLQALSTAQRAGGLPIPQGLGGTAPTSQSALFNAIRQSTSAANQAARNSPVINRPTLPR